MVKIGLKEKKKSKVGLFTICIVLSLSMVIFQSAIASTSFIVKSEIKSHAPVLIEQDNDFKKYSLPGNGTEDSPYVIKGLIIIEQTVGITIRNTTKHFIIQECKIRFCDIGIFIFNVSKGTAKIMNCSLSYIKDQNAVGAVGQAIFVSESEGTIIANNEIVESDIAIFLSISPKSIIKNNIIKEKYGITVISSQNTVIEKNALEKCGLNIYGKTEISEYSQYIIKNNTVNNKELGFLFNISNQTFEENRFGQLILVNCSQIILKNQIIGDTTTGITLYFCNSIEISDVHCYSNIFEGIACYGSSTIYIHDSRLRENGFGFTGCGIRLRETTDCIVEENKLNYNKGDGGILVSLSMKITIKNNELSHNRGEGISLKTCSNVEIKENICAENGIDGISLLASNNTIIEKNIVEANAEVGIFLFDSNNNLVRNNTIQENKDYGVMLMDAIADNKIRCTDNKIYLNFFIDNNINGSSQAFDNGYNNTWYDKEQKKGNYWSDNTKGNYVIDGTANAIDKHPIDQNLKRVKWNGILISLNFALISIVLIKQRRNKRKKK